MGSCLCLSRTRLNKINPNVQSARVAPTANNINVPVDEPRIQANRGAPAGNSDGLIYFFYEQGNSDALTDKLATLAARDAPKANNYNSVDELRSPVKRYAPRANNNVPAVKPGSRGAREASRANHNRSRIQADGDARKANNNDPLGEPRIHVNRDSPRVDNGFPPDNSEIHAKGCAPRDNANISVDGIRANRDSSRFHQHKTGIWYTGDNPSCSNNNNNFPVNKPRSPVNRHAPRGNRYARRGNKVANIIRVHNARIQVDAHRNNLQKNVLILLGISILYVVHISKAFKNRPSCKYDIFLSFRGSYTRKAFLSHLESGLRNQGIEVFVDRKLEKGKVITPGLEESIRKSKLGIIVFSKDFATSSYCLDETTVLIASHGRKHRVIPIFHGVNPSDVEFQNGTFADAFERHEETYKCKLYTVHNWRWALSKAANLAGWVSDDFLNESDMIAEIVEDVKKKLRQIRGNGEHLYFDSIVKFWRLCVLISKALCCAYERFYEEALLL